MRPFDKLRTGFDTALIRPTQVERYQGYFLTDSLIPSYCFFSDLLS